MKRKRKSENGGIFHAGEAICDPLQCVSFVKVSSDCTAIKTIAISDLLMTFCIPFFCSSIFSEQIKGDHIIVSSVTLDQLGLMKDTEICKG